MKKWIIQSPVPTIEVWAEDGIYPDDLRVWGYEQAKELIKEEWPHIERIDSPPPIADGEEGLCINKKGKIVDCIWHAQTGKWMKLK